MIEKIDHIAIAVHNIDDGLKLFNDILGFPLVSREIVEKQQVKVAKFSAGNIIIELVEPLTQDSPVGKFLAKRGPGLHHISLKSNNLEESIKLLQRNSIDSIGEIGTGSDGTRVIFLHPKQTLGVLIEIAQRNVDKVK